MSDINKIISRLFKSRWTANLAEASIEEQRKQLYKNLIDQTNGFWSGHTAYHILVDGGFIVDSKALKNHDGTRKGKKLTMLGEMFKSEMESESK